MYGYTRKDPIDMASMHMQDPFTYPPCRTPSRLRQKTSVISVSGTVIASTNAAGTFHTEMMLYGLDDTLNTLNHSDPATSTFNGVTVSGDAILPIRTVPQPNFNSSTILKKITAAGLRVTYIGREDARSGIFYGYLLQTGINETAAGATLSIDAARNLDSFGHTSTSNRLQANYSPGVSDHYKWADTTFSLHSPAPRLKIAGQGLPANTACIQIEYVYTMEFLPILNQYDQYDRQEQPYGDEGAQGALMSVQKVHPV